MQKLECPNCRERTIHPLRKLTLGPAAWTSCKACGAKVSVAWTSFFAALPFIVMVLVWRSLPVWAAITGAAVTLVLYGAVHQIYVPLVVKRS
jgi:hypothetical protein